MKAGYIYILHFSQHYPEKEGWCSYYTTPKLFTAMENQQRKQARKDEIDKALSACGYDRVLKVITRDFAKFFLPSEIVVYQYLCAQTFGFNRNTVERSYAAIARETGLSRKAVIDAVKHLLKVELIGKEIKGDSACIFWVEKIKYPKTDSEEYAKLEERFVKAHLEREKRDAEAVAKLDRHLHDAIGKIAKQIGKTKKETIRECIVSSPLYKRFVV